ncbi:MAG: hypothetical protein IJE22_06155 [Oscillibacter sp.]|nr:hypothetical protein [Oscillibacter sp.]MBQ2996792.1 hypothetical protein [Oscillibacter sp.]
MKYKLFAAALAVALLAGCTDRRETPPAQPEKAPPVSSETVLLPEREPYTMLADDVPAVLYVGEGYSLYIPDEGWTLELECDEEIPHQTWEADGDTDAALTVYHYENMSFMVALDRFTEESDYRFEQGAAGEAGDSLAGKDGDGDICKAVVAEGSHGITYVVAWEYPADMEETFGKLLAAMANTFELTE